MVGEQVLFFFKYIYLFIYFGGTGLHPKEKIRFQALKKVANRAAPGACGVHPLLPRDQAPHPPQLPPGPPRGLSLPLPAAPGAGGFRLRFQERPVP